MASTASGDLVSEVFRLITSTMAGEYAKRARIAALQTLNAQSPDKGMGEFLATMTALGLECSASFTTLNINYVQAFSAAEEVVVSRPTIARNAVPLNTAQFNRRMVGAGINSYKRDLKLAGLDSMQLPNNNVYVRKAIQRVEADLVTLVLNPGRNTTIAACESIPEYQFWTRLLSSGACDFCKTLGTRDNYRSKTTAEFEAHRTCHCGAEPGTPDWEPSEENLLAYERFKEQQKQRDINAGGHEIRRENLMQSRDRRQAKKGEISDEQVAVRAEARADRKEKAKLERQKEYGEVSDAEYDSKKAELDKRQAKRSHFYASKRAEADIEGQQKADRIAKEAEERVAQGKAEIAARIERAKKRQGGLEGATKKEIAGMITG